MSKLMNPMVVAALSICLSLGLGVAMTWRVLSTLVKAPPPKPELPEVAELKRKGWDFWTIEMDNLSNELKEERARLRKQAELLDQRAARIVLEEKEFAKLRAEIETMRKDVAIKVMEIGADEAKNLKTLANTYSTLTPKAAVAILKEMDDVTIVKLLSLMKTDVVGPIFEEMGKSATADNNLAKRAALLSERLRLMKVAKAGKAP
jgi:flagellar motility protein MotE (MotC chaperone)